MADNTSRTWSRKAPRPRGVITRVTRVESPRSTREQPEPSASFASVSAKTMRDEEDRPGPREGFATCSRLRAADRSAHMTISCSRMAAQRKQLAARIDGFCRRRVSHLLAFPGPFLLFRHSGQRGDDLRTLDFLALTARNVAERRPILMATYAWLGNALLDKLQHAYPSRHIIPPPNSPVNQAVSPVRPAPEPAGMRVAQRVGR